MAKRITGSSKSKSIISSLPKGIFTGRVRAIILDDSTYPDSFQELGDWSSIGTIFWDKPTAPNIGEINPTSTTTAKPLFPNEKKYPLVNEVVYIISLPNSDNQSSPNSISFYYFQPINIWTSNHHNAIPNPYLNTNPPSQQQDYQTTEGGNVRRVTDGGTEINLGQTFSEKLDIKTLLPYEGDIIYEGRWGQSFRYGSTVNDANIPNSWSSAGENGDPITILKNGQYDDGNDPWVPQVEDINTDLSSIYLTSTQTLPIDVASKKYDSYFSSPISTNKFDSEQVVINSGRILFNAKSDNILLSSFDTINLNSINSLNIDTPKTIIQSKEIYLGDKYATEPVILGDTFLADLQSLLNKINNLTSALMVPMSLYPPVGPNAPLPLVASSVKSQCAKMIGKINKYKSKVSKSK